MKKRIRLTDKRRAKARRAVEDNIPYPGSVNQEDRKFKKHNQYDNWDEVIDHPLQNKDTEWKKDEHDEIGFGVENKSYSASLLKSASAKAVHVATLLLGEEVSDEVIEAQAVEFVALGNEALNATIKRFADTEVTVGNPSDAEAEEEEVADEEDVEEAIESSEIEAEGEEEEMEEMDYEDDGEDESEEDELEEMEAGEESEEEIELTSTLDDGEAEDVGKEATTSLQALFDEQADKATGVKTIAKKAGKKKAKKGVKKLGGQPKKASSGGEQLNLSSIWKDAPDVSGTFGQ